MRQQHRTIWTIFGLEIEGKKRSYVLVRIKKFVIQAVSKGMYARQCSESGHTGLGLNLKHPLGPADSDDRGG